MQRDWQVDDNQGTIWKTEEWKGECMRFIEKQIQVGRNIFVEIRAYHIHFLK